MYAEVEKYLKAKKPFKLQVTPWQSEEIQTLCFKYGVKWVFDGTTLSHLNKPWLYIGDGEILWGDCNEYYGNYILKSLDQSKGVNYYMGTR